MKVLNIRDIMRNDCTMDIQCEHCGHIEVDKSAYNDSNYIHNVVPDRYCPHCNLNAKGEPKQTNK